MPPAPSFRDAARRLRQGLSLAAMALALLTLVGTLLGHGLLSALGSGLVPMSPLAVLLVLLLGSAAVEAERRPEGTPPGRLGIALAVVAGGVSLAFALGHAAGEVLPVEAWLLRLWPRLQLTSVLTDLALLGTALAFLGRRVPFGRWWARQLAALLALVPLLLGLVVLVTYFSGAPLLYETGYIPMSLPAAICVLLLGSAQFLAAGRDTWPLAAFRADQHRSRFGFSPRIVAAYLGCGLLIFIGGATVLGRQTRATRERVQAELASIVDLKARLIATWVAERLGDAEVIARGGLVQTQLERYLARSPQAPAEGDLLGWLRTAQESFHYQRITLFDANGRPRATVPAGPLEAFEDPAEVQVALRASGVLWSDLHRAPGHADVHMALWVPVRAAGGGPNRGTLLFMMDPRTALFPMVESWPTASPSAETQLVRREGGQVLFLNNLRHRLGGAMTLRQDLAAQPDMPAVRAALGFEGIVEATDYRGVPVVAVLHGIPGTSWRMVAKVDAAEVYGPLRQKVWVGGALLMGLVVLLGLGLGLLQRHREAKLLRGQLDLARRYETVLREASDIILFMDGEGRILEANDQAVSRYGYTLEELRRMTVFDLRAPETRGEGRELYQRLRNGGAARFETTHLHRNGTAFPVEVSSKALDLGGEPRVLSFVRDISERRRQEREIERMTRLYAALSQVNQAIVWSPDRDALFAKICEVMIEFGRFDMAWIGLEDPGGGPVQVAASWGDHHGYLERIRVERGPTAYGAGPVGRALREAGPCVVNDFLGTPGTEPWREAAQVSGFRAVAAFPIRQDGRVVGALAVYSKEVGFFGPAEEALLVEAAMDISFALDHLALEDQRRSAEVALMESERRLKEAQDAGGIGTYTWFIQENHWTGSPYLDQLFGIGPDHPRNLEGWTQVVAPDFRASMADYVAGIIERHEPFDLDYPILRASDGQRRWVHGRGEIHRDAEDRPVAMVGVIQDITERKLAELELSISEETFSKVFKACPEAIAIARMVDGAYIEVNDVFLEMVGLPREAVIGRTSSDLQVWADPGDRAAYSEALQTQGSIQHQEFRFRMRGGHLRDCLVSSECIQLDGQACSLNFIQDITDRKQSEVALVESNQRLRLASDSARMAVWDWDLRAGTMTWDDRMFELYGRTRQEIQGTVQDWKDGLHPEDLEGALRECEAALRGETPFDTEFRVRHRDGTVLWIKANATVLRDADGTPVRMVGVNRDVTDRHRAEEEKAALQAQLHQSQKLESLGALAGGVAHDMNNVLGAILGLASTLRETTNPFSPAAKNLDTIMTACMRGRGVVKSLLYFARKDLQEERSIDLNELVREMSQLLGHTTPKRIQVRLELAEGLGWLRGDPGALSHALMNLCVNALDAMPGTGTLSIRTQADAAGGLTLRVEDTGEGMPPEILAKAMDPFFTTKPQGKGTGLGLGMVYGTMQAHEGTFELRSEPGRGTEAILRFPASRVEASAPVAPPEPATVIQTGRPLSILLVDDDDLIRESAVPLLEVLGHTVNEAATGARAIQLLEEGLAVDLVVLDMNMPGLSGAQTLPRLLDLRPGLPVIMATGYSDDEVAPLLVGRPSVSAIRKPYSLKEIQMKIQNLNLQPAPPPPAG